MLEFICVEDIAYCAGLFEGEGWVGQHTSRNTWRLGINMTDLEPLERVCLTFGGKILGPYDRSKHGATKPIYSWVIHGYNNVQRIYDKIKYYLSPRRIRQFENALSIKPRELLTSANCGLASNNGYGKHRRDKEAPCAECRKAHAEYGRWWRASC